MAKEEKKLTPVPPTDLPVNPTVDVNLKKEEEITLDNFVPFLKKQDGYMVGFTTLKDGQLKHYLFTDKFMVADMLKSHNNVRQLIIDDLEKR